MPHRLYGRNADGELGEGGEGPPPEEITEGVDYSLDHAAIWANALNPLGREGS